jgi:hypothetical protein
MQRDESIGQKLPRPPILTYFAGQVAMGSTAAKGRKEPVIPVIRQTSSAGRRLLIMCQEGYRHKRRSRTVRRLKLILLCPSFASDHLISFPLGADLSGA